MLGDLAIEPGIEADFVDHAGLLSQARQVYQSLMDEADQVYPQLDFVAAHCGVGLSRCWRTTVNLWRLKLGHSLVPLHQNPAAKLIAMEKSNLFLCWECQFLIACDSSASSPCAWVNAEVQVP